MFKLFGVTVGFNAYMFMIPMMLLCGAFLGKKLSSLRKREETESVGIRQLYCRAVGILSSIQLYVESGTGIGKVISVLVPLEYHIEGLTILVCCAVGVIAACTARRIVDKTMND